MTDHDHETDVTRGRGTLQSRKDDVPEVLGPYLSGDLEPDHAGGQVRQILDHFVPSSLREIDQKYHAGAVAREGDGTEPALAITQPSVVAAAGSCAG